MYASPSSSVDSPSSPRLACFCRLCEHHVALDLRRLSRSSLSGWLGFPDPAACPACPIPSSVGRLFADPVLPTLHPQRGAVVRSGTLDAGTPPVSPNSGYGRGSDALRQAVSVRHCAIAWRQKQGSRSLRVRGSFRRCGAVRGPASGSRPEGNNPVSPTRKASDSRDFLKRSGEGIEPSNRRATTACRF